MNAKATPIALTIILTTRPIPLSSDLSSPESGVVVVWVSAVENRVEDLLVETEDWIDEEGRDEPVNVRLALAPIKSTIPCQSPDRSTRCQLTWRRCGLRRNVSSNF